MVNVVHTAQRASSAAGSLPAASAGGEAVYLAPGQLRGSGLPFATTSQA